MTLGFCLGVSYLTVKIQSIELTAWIWILPQLLPSSVTLGKPFNISNLNVSTCKMGISRIRNTQVGCED